MVRKEFEMTEGDLKELLDAMRPVPLMYLSGGQEAFQSQQENANAAWQKLGDKYGFEYMTVESVPGKGDRFFTAVVKEIPKIAADNPPVQAGDELTAADLMADLENIKSIIVHSHEQDAHNILSEIETRIYNLYSRIADNGVVGDQPTGTADETSAPAAVDAPNDAAFPRPVWDAAKEIEAKRAFPGQPTIDQITETAAIIWAKVEPLYDAVYASYIGEDPTMLGPEMKKWEF